MELSDIMRLYDGEIECCGYGCGMRLCKSRGVHAQCYNATELCCNFDPHEDYEEECSFDTID